MDSALSMVLDRAREAQAKRVLVIRLRIGAISGVVPDALEFAFQSLVPGTLAEGAQLVIEEVPVRFWCPTCKSQFQSEDILAECPECRKRSES